MHRFPMVVWQDAQGAFTALVLNGEAGDAPAAKAPTAEKARDQLKEYLTWLYDASRGADRRS